MMHTWNTRLFVLSTLVCSALACAPVAVPPASDGSAANPAPRLPAQPASRHTLEGTFTAPQFQDGSRPIRAVFTAAGEEGLWDVAFHFRFNGAQHIYRGTAEGSLQEGGLQGTVTNSQRRTFTFTGQLNRGVFEGTHAETTRRGRRGPTGTMTLRSG